MPTNKNAIIRYQILDECLSDRYHDYTLDDLTAKVNEYFKEINPDRADITRRCIEMDIHFLEYEGPWYMEIMRYSAPYYNAIANKTVTKRCLKYANPDATIFRKEMTDDEKYLLSESLSLLGQFDGLPELDGLERLRQSLKVGERQQIVSFTKNPLKGKSLFGELFTAISQKQVIELHYHKFGLGNENNKVNLCPYLLKEYNSRWFLIAAAEGESKLLTFALDRIDKVKPLSAHTYIEYNGDINEMYEDIVGVTYIENNPLLKITFWVSDVSKDYVMTKPLHESQRKLRDSVMREKYPQLEGGAFFQIECRENYELIRELTSFGAELVVLSPDSVRDKIIKRIESMRNIYKVAEEK